MSDSHPLVLWVADHPVAQIAHIHRFPTYEHLTNKSSRDFWALRRLVSREPEALTRKLVPTPEDYAFVLYSVRNKRIVDDIKTPRADGIYPGDVLVMTPSEAQWLGMMDSLADHFPPTIPLNIPMSDRAQTLVELDSEMKKQELSGGVHIHTGGGAFYNAGVIAQKISDSYNQLTVSNIDPRLKDLLSQLHSTVSAMTPYLEPDEAEVASEDLTELTSEAMLGSGERRPARLRRAADSLVSLASKAAAVGLPVIDLITKITSLVGR